MHADFPSSERQPGNPAASASGPAARELDLRLLERVARGDSAALGELYDRLAPMLLALARRILDDVAEAEEVVQETFLQVWNQAGRYDAGRSAVSTWLVLITRSRSIDRLRTRKVVGRTLDGFQQENKGSYTSPEGARSVQDEDRRRRVRRELDSLPVEQREVLELAFFEGWTQSEIAERTGTPLGTVKTRTLLAMKKLRKTLQAEIRELI